MRREAVSVRDAPAPALKDATDAVAAVFADGTIEPVSQITRSTGGGSGRREVHGAGFRCKCQLCVCSRRQRAELRKR